MSGIIERLALFEATGLELLQRFIGRGFVPAGSLATPPYYFQHCPPSSHGCRNLRLFLIIIKLILTPFFHHTNLYTLSPPLLESGLLYIHLGGKSHSSRSHGNWHDTKLTSWPFRLPAAAASIGTTTTTTTEDWLFTFRLSLPNSRLLLFFPRTPIPPWRSPYFPRPSRTRTRSYCRLLQLLRANRYRLHHPHRAHT